MENISYFEQLALALEWDKLVDEINNLSKLTPRRMIEIECALAHADKESLAFVCNNIKDKRISNYCSIILKTT